MNNGSWLPQPAVVIRALTSAGQLTLACTLAREILLTCSLKHGDAAEVRAALVTALTVSGNAQAAVAEAERLLADPALPAALSPVVAATRLIGLVSYDVDGAERHAQSVIGRPDRRYDDLTATALTVAAKARWRCGRLAEACALARAAVRTEANAIVGFGSGEAVAPSRCFSHVVLADKLASLGETTEADLVLRRFVDGIGDFDRSPYGAILSATRAMIEARAGRLGAAFESADRGVVLAERADLRPMTPHTRAVLARIAVRLGDYATAAQSLAVCRELTQSTPADVNLLQALATLQLAEATDGAGAAGELLSHDYRRLCSMPDVLSGEPTTAAWLAHIALAAGDHHLAEQTAVTARQLAAVNPELPSVGAATTHVEGVLKGDPVLLLRAAAQHRDPWSRARAMEDRALILCQQSGSTERRTAADALEQAMAGYRVTGARGDELRTEACLRRMGRMGPRSRNGWPRQAADCRWPQLTPQEASVAKLVAQGLTNQRVASLLHLSPHTVNFHLRAIFRKLGIRSRVELAGIYPRHPPA